MVRRGREGEEREEVDFSPSCKNSFGRPCSHDDTKLFDKTVMKGFSSNCNRNYILYFIFARLVDCGCDPSVP